jgi:hypothetical protein
MISNDNLFLGLINFLCTFIVFVGTLSVGIFTIWNNRRLDTNRRKTETTLAFIKEFYSNEFMFHRKALWNLHKKTVNNELSIEKIAEDFVYPFSKILIPDTEHKKVILTEHNHLTMYLSFLQRLSISIDKDQVDVEAIKKAISDAMIWHAELALKVCYEIIDKADQKFEVYEEKLKKTESNKNLQAAVTDKGMPGRTHLIKRPAQMVIDLHKDLDLSPDVLESEIIHYDWPEVV